MDFSGRKLGTCSVMIELSTSYPESFSAGTTTTKNQAESDCLYNLENFKGKELWLSISMQVHDVSHECSVTYSMFDETTAIKFSFVSKETEKRVTKILVDESVIEYLLHKAMVVEMQMVVQKAPPDTTGTNESSKQNNDDNNNNNSKGELMNTDQTFSDMKILNDAIREQMEAKEKIQYEKELEEKKRMDLESKIEEERKKKVEEIELLQAQMQAQNQIIAAQGDLEAKAKEHEINTLRGKMTAEHEEKEKMNLKMKQLEEELHNLSKKSKVCSIL